MKIRMKIGTGPANYYHVCRKRKLPVLGDVIKIKTENKPYIKPERVRVDEVRHVHGEPLFFAERW